MQAQEADVRAQHHRGAALPISPAPKQDLSQLSLAGQMLSCVLGAAETPRCSPAALRELRSPLLPVAGHRADPADHASFGLCQFSASAYLNLTLLLFKVMLPDKQFWRIPGITAMSRRPGGTFAALPAEAVLRDARGQARQKSGLQQRQGNQSYLGDSLHLVPLLK